METEAESDIGNGLRQQFEGRMEVEIKVGDDAGDRKDTDVNNRPLGRRSRWASMRPALQPAIVLLYPPVRQPPGCAKGC